MRDYFDGNIIRDEVIGLIKLYFFPRSNTYPAEYGIRQNVLDDDCDVQYVALPSPGARS